MQRAVILNNIRSAENVGSIFRTGDAFGVTQIFLVGISPAPLDRFGRINTKLAKSALGAEHFVKWQRFETLPEALEVLRKENFKIVAVEQADNSTNYKLLSNNLPAAFVFGNEVEGLSAEDLRLCDEVVEIPMSGMKESLNVAVSVGVILSNTQ